MFQHEPMTDFMAASYHALITMRYKTDIKLEMQSRT